MGEGPLLLGLDVGTTRMKALVMGVGGSAHSSAACPTPFAKDGEESEMPVEDLMAAVRGLLRQLDELDQVAGVGVGGVAESGAPVDAGGRALAPVIAWHDPRGEEIVERLEDHFEGELPGRIGQPLRTVSSVAKLGWLLDHGVTGARRWLGVPELCLFHLTGAEATEHSLAARTGAYHVVDRSYMPEVAAALGVGDDVFPPVLGAGSPMGKVSAEAAGWSGLSEGIPVTLAGHDHLAGAAGVGAGPGDVVNSVGTAETVLRRAAEPPSIGRALELRTAVSVRPGGDEWVVLASAARAGLVLEAVAEVLDRPVEELDRLAEAADGVQVDDELVRSIQAGERPGLPDGLPGEVWNGLLRALSERTFESAGRLSALLGPGERVVAFGGGSRSDPWMRAKAALSDLPVVRALVSDAVAHGAACWAGVAAGAWPSMEEAPTSATETVED